MVSDSDATYRPKSCAEAVGAFDVSPMPPVKMVDALPFIAATRLRSAAAAAFSSAWFAFSGGSGGAETLGPPNRKPIITPE